MTHVACVYKPLFGSSNHSRLRSVQTAHRFRSKATHPAPYPARELHGRKDHRTGGKVYSPPRRNGPAGPRGPPPFDTCGTSMSWVSRGEAREKVLPLRRASYAFIQIRTNRKSVSQGPSDGCSRPGRLPSQFNRNQAFDNFGSLADGFPLIGWSSRPTRTISSTKAKTVWRWNPTMSRRENSSFPNTRG